MMLTSIDAVLDARPLGDGRLGMEIPTDWGQGRSTFGGLIAAVTVRGMTPLIDPDRPARSFLITFVGPVPAGPVTVESRILRRGGSTTFAEARLVRDGATLCTATGAFAASRPSNLSVEPAPRPEAPPVDAVEDLPYVDGVTPTFTRHFAYRWTIGGPPFSGSPQGPSGGWCRLRLGGLATPEHLLALVDAWPSPTLQPLTQPAPASSITWAVELLPTPPEPATDWWFYRCVPEACREGYAHARAEFWTPSGHLAALSRQIVAVFA